MIKLKPIIFANNLFKVHPLQAEDKSRSEIIETDILNIFGNPENIPYNSEKHIRSLEEAQILLSGASLGNQLHSQYTFFITFISTRNIIGEIIIIPPFMAEDHGVKDSWLIEYYLHKDAWNNGIMTGILAAVIENLQEQGIKKMGAFVDKENLGSIRVLEKNNFINTGNPNSTNKYFELSF